MSQNWTPDLIISIRFGQIFHEPIISLPKFGIINLHSGILPHYRGIMATFWAMLDNQKQQNKNQIGCTLHQINDRSIDTGDIINIHKINSDPSLPFLHNVLRLYRSGANMIADYITNLEMKKKPTAKVQNKNDGQYFGYPDDMEVRKFLHNVSALF